MSNPAPIAPISGAPERKSDEILKRLVERRATLKADAEYITDEIETIDAQLIELLGGTAGTFDVAGTKVQVREYSRTDLKKLAEAYPADQFPQLYATAIDAAAVKSAFAPAALEPFVVRGKKSVVVP